MLQAVKENKMLTITWLVLEQASVTMLRLLTTNLQSHALNTSKHNAQLRFKPLFFAGGTFGPPGGRKCLKTP